MMKNKKGSSTITFLILCPMLIVIFLSSILSIQKLKIKTKIRSETLLCSKYYTKQTRKYLKNMVGLNQTLKTLYLLDQSIGINPKVKAAAQAGKFIAIASQIGISFSQVKKINSFESCSKYSHNFMLDLMMFKLWKRNYDWTAPLGKKKWNRILTVKKKYLKTKILFSYRMKSHLQRSHTLTTKEHLFPLRQSSYFK